MIIINQRKDIIINFNQIKAIAVEPFELSEDEKTHIVASIDKDYGIDIGSYATEKRAKEVLAELESKYVMGSVCFMPEE